MDKKHTIPDPVHRAVLLVLSEVSAMSSESWHSSYFFLLALQVFLHYDTVLWDAQGWPSFNIFV